MTTIGSENWTATSSTAWPAQWTAGVNQGTASVASARGRLTPSGTGYRSIRRFMAGIGTSTAKRRTTGTFILSAITEQYIRISGRETVGTTGAYPTGYFIRIDAGVGTWKIYGGYGTGEYGDAPAVALTMVAGNVYGFTIDVDVATTSARVWNITAGQTEPTTWQSSWMDSDYGGDGGVPAISQQSGNTTNPYVEFGPLTVTDGASGGSYTATSAPTAATSIAAAAIAARAGTGAVGATISLSQTAAAARQAAAAVASGIAVAATGAAAATRSATVTAGTDITAASSAARTAPATVGAATDLAATSTAARTVPAAVTTTITPTATTAAATQRTSAVATGVTIGAMIVDAFAVTTPAAGSHVPTPRPLFSGTGEPGATLDVYSDTSANLIGSATVSASGTWSFTPIVDLDEGASSYSAYQSNPFAYASVPLTAPYRAAATVTVGTDTATAGRADLTAAAPVTIATSAAAEGHRTLFATATIGVGVGSVSPAAGDLTAGASVTTAASLDASAARLASDAVEITVTPTITSSATLAALEAVEITAHLEPTVTTAAAGSTAADVALALGVLAAAGTVPPGRADLTVDLHITATATGGTATTATLTVPIGLLTASAATASAASATTVGTALTAAASGARAGTATITVGVGVTAVAEGGGPAHTLHITARIRERTRTAATTPRTRTGSIPARRRGGFIVNRYPYGTREFVAVSVKDSDSSITTGLEFALSKGTPSGSAWTTAVERGSDVGFILDEDVMPGTWTVFARYTAGGIDRPVVECGQITVSGRAAA